MPNKNKAKGSAFERDIAKLLTETYGKEFCRMPTSGQAGTVNNNNQLQGDIVTPEGCDLSIECKRVKKIELFNEDFDFSFKIKKYIEQASSSGMPWLLIVKEDHKKPFVIFNDEPRFNLPENYIRYVKQYAVVELSEFLKVNPDLFK